jgi:hypothetical protein
LKFPAGLLNLSIVSALTDLTMNRYRKLVIFICFVSLVSNIAGQSVINCFISHDTLNRKPAGKMICGNFIELGFAHQIDGLWNQKLRNASFEEVNPYTEPVWGWLGRKAGDDMSTESWWHSG